MRKLPSASAVAMSVRVRRAGRGGARRVAPLGQQLRQTSGGPVVGDTLASVVAAYRDTWRRVDAIVATASLDERCRNVGDDTPVNLRWVAAHLLEETARPAGRADSLRELIDGHTGR
jgi:hypothetical protein